MYGEEAGQVSVGVTVGDGETCMKRQQVSVGAMVYFCLSFWPEWESSIDTLIFCKKKNFFES